MDKRSPKFTVWEGGNRQWYWHLAGANGEIVALGGGYNDQGAVKEGIERVIALAQEAAPIVEVRT